MGKGPSLRPSKAKNYRAQNGNHSVDDDEDEPVKNEQRSFLAVLQEYFPEPIALFALISLIFMLIALGILLWVNSTKDIHACIADISREVEVLDYEQDRSTHNRRKDTEDLSEVAAAADAMERAVRQGNLAAARRIVAQLAASRAASQEDIDTMTSIVDSAEMANPIAELSRCRADGVLSWIKDNGGVVLDGKGAPQGGSGNGIVLADLNRPGFDSNAESSQPQRGLVLLREVAAGEQLLSVPSSLFLSLWSEAATSPALLPLLQERAAGTIDAFGALAALLLTESHNSSSYYRRYICSLPVHVPLPFQWEDNELPTEFLADQVAVEGRDIMRTLVETSFNTTVARLTDRYPEVFPSEHLTRAKWDWAASIVLSRAVAMRRASATGAPTLEGSEVGSMQWILDIVSHGAGGASVETEAQVLVPGVDLLNHHEGDPATAVQVSLDPLPSSTSGAVAAVVRSGPGGGVPGLEVAMVYGDERSMCGARPLNRYGFVMPPCPSDSDASSSSG